MSELLDGLGAQFQRDVSAGPGVALTPPRYSSQFSKPLFEGSGSLHRKRLPDNVVAAAQREEVMATDVNSEAKLESAIVPL